LKGRGSFSADIRILPPNRRIQNGERGKKKKSELQRGDFSLKVRSRKHRVSQAFVSSKKEEREGSV